MLALARISRVAAAWLQPRSRVRLSEARGLGTSDAPASSTMAEADAYASIRRGVAPATGRSLADVAAELWGHALPGERAMPGERSARKLLRKPLKGPLYASWYPKRLESYDWNEFKLTEKQIRRQAKLRQLRAAGKGPPKKGSGKRQK